MTRAEHMAWAKQRAIEELERGSEVNAIASMLNAIASMLSDLGKHPETERSVMIGTLTALTINRRDPESVQRWIEGFN